MRIALILAGFTFATAARAQTIASTVTLSTGEDSQSRTWGRARVQVPAGPGMTVLRRAFSAEVSSGPIGSVSSTRRVYRDAAGRTRAELLLSNPDGAPLLIELNDPAAGVIFVLDVSRKTAHRLSYSPSSRLAVQPIIGPPQSPSVKGAAPRVTEESLGSKTIAGIPAEGQLFTTIVPPVAEGSDAITRTEEIWTSPGLWLTLRRIIHDPRDGDWLFELAKVDLNEPDAALFQPPSDYQIVRHTSGFDLGIGDSPTGGAQPGPDGVYRIGSGVSPPVPISQPPPSLTENAHQPD